MDSMDEGRANRQWEVLGQELEGACQLIEAGVREGIGAHGMERQLWQWALQMGRLLLEGFFTLSGDGDVGAQLLDSQGKRWRRLPDKHTRPYRSVFGEHTLERAVYGTREGQRIEAVPFDERLGLPAGKYSYLLQNWSQELATRMPFEEVACTLERILGQRLPVDSLARETRRLSKTEAAFWPTLPVPRAEEEGSLLVVSGDHKGVPMRKAPAAGRTEPALAVMAPAEGGVKPGTKKMAQLGALYSIEPYLRTPQEVTAALFHEGAALDAPPSRPRPAHKWVRGVLLRDEHGSTAPQTETLFGWLAARAEARNPLGEKVLIVLMDGERDQWNNGAAAHLPAHRVEILDLIHALGYLWEAADVFFPLTRAEAGRFVRERVLRLLQGEVGSVVRGLRIMAGRHALGRKRRERLEKICAYFEYNAARMDYGRYLAAGYPIASGVIEGACRHLVCDRMERSGMRWTMPGAQAMLSLRSIAISGLWDQFMAFHILSECRRLYPERAANDPPFLEKAA